jgi:hypothetical protein
MRATAKPLTPAGFYMAGFFSASLGMMSLSAFLTDPAGHTLGDALTDGALALIVVLSFVATEALWALRPWAWRASLTLALAFAGAWLVAWATDPGAGLVDGIVVVGLFSCVFLVPLLAYIRSRSRMLWPPPPRVPVSARPARPTQASGARP